MYDDYTPEPDCRTEMNILVDHARRILTAYGKRSEVSGGEGWVEFEMNKLRESMHYLFGDPAPKPMPVPVPVERTAKSVPAHSRRFPTNRRVHALAS